MNNNDDKKKACVEAVAFLKEIGKFFVATIDECKPKIRPFGAVTEFEDKIYLVTSSDKAVYNQIQNNPNVSICACDEKRKWLRIEGVAKSDNRIIAKQAVLDDNPVLQKNKRFESASDPNMMVIYIDDAKIDFN